MVADVASSFKWADRNKVGPPSCQRSAGGSGAGGGGLSHRNTPRTNSYHRSSDVATSALQEINSTLRNRTAAPMGSGATTLTGPQDKEINVVRSGDI